jgi:hypothetical protein
MIGFQTLTMLEDKAPAPEYGTYAYSALADSMGLGVCDERCCCFAVGYTTCATREALTNIMIHVGRHQLRLR